MSLSLEPNSGIIYILVPVHNRRKTTLAFAECLIQQTDQNYELVLIDDGSTDGTSDAVKSLCKNTTVIRGEGNWWWAGSLQQAYSLLSRREVNNNDIVLIINDDVTFEKNYLENGRKLVEQNPNSQIGSWYIERGTGKLADRGASCDFQRFIIGPAQDDSQLVFLSTRGLFLRATDFLKSGGFVPDKIPHYLSDYEFTFRLKRDLNLKMMTSPEIFVYGLDDQSGTSSLRGLNPISSIKVIFSERFRDNPVYLARFVSMCFPKKYQRNHKRYVWVRVIKRWIFTWPQPLLMIILILFVPVRALFRTVKHLLRVVKRKRYDLEPPEIT